MPQGAALRAEECFSDREARGVVAARVTPRTPAHRCNAMPTHEMSAVMVPGSGRSQPHRARRYAQACPAAMLKAEGIGGWQGGKREADNAGGGREERLVAGRRGGDACSRRVQEIGVSTTHEATRNNENGVPVVGRKPARRRCYRKDHTAAGDGYVSENRSAIEEEGIENNGVHVSAFSGTMAFHAAARPAEQAAGKMDRLRRRPPPASPPPPRRCEVARQSRLPAPA